MNIMYKCHCMKVETSIVVLDRRPLGDIMDWMGAVTTSIAVDHKALSPNCKLTTMEYAKIPLDSENSQIGVPDTKQ